MAFGKRAGMAGGPSGSAERLSPVTSLAGSVGAVIAGRPRATSSRRHVAGTALVGILLGFGGVTAGSTFVHASERAGIFNFFEDLFRPAPPRVAVQPRQAPKRYASLPDGRRISATRSQHYTPRPVAGTLDRRTRVGLATPMRAAPAGSIGFTAGPRTVCVRTCDGYVFPLGRLRSQQDLPVHQAACTAACPNARTALFTLPSGEDELDRSVSLKGQPYLAAAWANVYRQKRVQNCSCQPSGLAAMPLPVSRDATIRVGDVVATEDSAEVVTGLSHGRVQLADYRSARGLTKRVRRGIDQRVGTIQRDADEAAFRRALRTADNRAARIRLAEAGAAHLRTIEATPGFSEAARPADDRQGFGTVRVVSPSLYDR